MWTLPASVDAVTMGAWVRSTSDVPLKLVLHTRDRRGQIQRRRIPTLFRAGRVGVADGYRGT